MAVRLNSEAFTYAKELLFQGRVVVDDEDLWGQHHPSAEKQAEFIRAHGLDEYGKWHLGVDNDEPRRSKDRYTLLYGDFEDVHRCAVLYAEREAGFHEYHDVERAAAHLHGIIEGMHRRRK